MQNFAIYTNPKNDFPSATKEHKVTIVLYDPATVVNGGDTQYGIIYGYMKNNFSYSSQGAYTDVWSTNFGNSMFLKVLQDETRRNFFNYGYITKKMYSNGPSPSITIEFRAYAGNDDNVYSARYTKDNTSLTNPVDIADALINATLPRVSTNAVALTTSLTGTIQRAGNAANGVGDILTGTASMAYDGLKTIVDVASSNKSGLQSDAQNIQNAENTISQGADAFTSKKPPVCKLTIGNIFDKDYMAVKNVDVTLSKEYLSEGVPLYGDFSVTFESLFNSSVIYGNSDDSKSLRRTFGSGLNTNKTASNRISFD